MSVLRSNLQSGNALKTCSNSEQSIVLSIPFETVTKSPNKNHNNYTKRPMLLLLAGENIKLSLVLNIQTFNLKILNEGMNN